MSEKNEKLKKNLELKQALDDLVSVNDKIEVDKGDEIASVRKEGQAQLYTDFNKLSTTAKEEAKKIVSSIVKFYLDLDIIDKDESVQYKKKLQEMSISAILFQMQTSEYVCIKLLEEIDAGNANLKTFEVYSKLQDTMMKIVEVQSNIISKTSEQWKKHRSDSEEIKLFKIPEASDAEEGQELRIKGGRKLVEIAQKLSEEKGLNKIDEYEISVDPREAYRESLKKGEDDPENKVDDELFS